MTLYVQVLGPIRIHRGSDEVDPGPRQQRSVLALLLAGDGRPLGMTELIELLWGAGSPPSAVNVIHKYVGGLRRLLEPELPRRAPGAYLARHGDGYRFVGGPGTLDLTQFRRLVGEARRHADLDCYEKALRLNEGAAGGGLAETAAARSMFASLDGEVAEALLAAAGLAVRLGQASRVLAPLRRTAERDPLNETLQAGLITTLAAAGNRAEALAVYRSVSERLADELGLDPGRELRAAYHQIVNPPPDSCGSCQMRARTTRPAVAAFSTNSWARTVSSNGSSAAIG